MYTKNHRQHPPPPSSPPEPFRTPPKRSSLARAAAVSGGGGGGITMIPDGPSSTSVVSTRNSSTVQQQQQYEISIYWDFENLQLPSSATAVDASKAIVQAVSQYGRIVDRRLYFDMTCQAGNTNWSALDSSGFDLVNTPRRNQKETLDKKMIADILTFSWDSSARNDHTTVKPCVVLLTSDGDYAYTLNKLRDRGVMSIVMYGRDQTVANVLKESADIAMSFEQDVLRDFFQNGTAAGSSAITGGGGGSSTVTSREDAMLICRILSQQAEKGAVEPGLWMQGAKVSIAFRQALGLYRSSCGGDVMKERYRGGKDYAVGNGWLENGRHRMIAGRQGDVVAVPNNGSANDPRLYSAVDFLRVTPQGYAALGSPKRTSNSSSSGRNTSTSRTKLFIKNIPSNVRIQEIVQYFETTHNVKIIRGQTIKAPFQSPFIFARVELESEADVEHILQKATSRDGMILRGRQLDIKLDRSNDGYAVHSEYGYQRPFIQTEKNSYMVPQNHEVSDDDFSTLCKVLHQRLLKHGVEANPEGWTEGGQIAVDFKNALATTGKLFGSNPDHVKELFRKIKTEAIAKGLVQIGRRRLKSVGRFGDIEVFTRHSSTIGYSKEQYMRLTDKGRRSMTQAPHGKSAETGATYVKITGLPESIEIQALVTFFETSHDCPVQKVVLGPSGDLSGSAHVEFVSAQDATRILKFGSSWDGLKFQNKHLAAILGVGFPQLEDIDPSRVYEAPCPDTVPTSISTLDQCTDVESLLETQSQRSGVTFQTTSTDYSEFDPQALFCRVLYDQCSTNDNGEDVWALTQWRSVGTIGSNFQHLYTGSKDEQKGRFQKARMRVLGDGLAELGRRVLNSSSKEIISVPFFNGQAPAVPGLSNETYVRLTAKGIALAETCPKIKRYETPSAPSAPSRNMYITNLSTSTYVDEIVAFIESTYNVTINRACTSFVNSDSKCIGCHLEFETANDFDKVMQIAGKYGIIYQGRAIQLRLDRHVPLWNSSYPGSTYKRKDTSEVPLEETETTQDSTYAIESPELTHKDSNETMETEPMDITIDEKQEETLESTDLLFGDNLALLYAQSAPRKQDTTVDISSDCEENNSKDEIDGVKPADFASNATLGSTKVIDHYESEKGELVPPSQKDEALLELPAPFQEATEEKAATILADADGNDSIKDGGTTEALDFLWS